MTKEAQVTEVLDTKYKCPCGTTYQSKEEAEQCITPRGSKFDIGKYVQVSCDLTFGNPAYDDGFGNEKPYDHIPKGTIGRIKAVHDRYDDNGAKASATALLLFF